MARRWLPRALFLAAGCSGSAVDPRGVPAAGEIALLVLDVSLTPMAFAGPPWLFLVVR